MIRHVILGVLVSMLLATVAFARVSVRGYTRRDGTYVQPHQRTIPNRKPYDNYRFPGNYNPNTGRFTGGNEGTYLQRYYGRRSAQ